MSTRHVSEIDWVAALFSSISIVAVVICHVGRVDFATGPFDLFEPYSWFLAGFAFVSGYLYREGTECHPIAYALRRLRRMIVPLLLINAAFAIVINYLRSHFGFTFGSDLSPYVLIVSPFENCHDLGWNMPMWFIAPFCFSQCIHVMIRWAVSSMLHLLPIPNEISRGGVDLISLMLCLAVGVLTIQWAGPGRIEPGNVLLACRTLYFVPWLALGKWYKTYIEKRDTLSSGRYFAVVALAELLLLYASNGNNSTTPSWGEFPHGAAITMLSAVVGIAFWWRVCRIIAPWLSDGAKRIVWALSGGSFSIMCFHILGMFLLASLFGLAASITPLFGLWDANEYLSSYAYIYLPHGIGQFGLLYVVFSICFSLALHVGHKKLWDHISVRFAGRDW